MAETVTLQYKRVSSDEWKEHTLQKVKDTLDNDKLSNVLVLKPNRSIGKRGKVRVRLDSGEVYHHDPRYNLTRSVQIGELAKVH